MVDEYFQMSPYHSKHTLTQYTRTYIHTHTHTHTQAHNTHTHASSNIYTHNSFSDSGPKFSIRQPYNLQGPA